MRIFADVCSTEEKVFTRGLQPLKGKVNGGRVGWTVVVASYKVPAI